MKNRKLIKMFRFVISCLMKMIRLYRLFTKIMMCNRMPFISLPRERGWYWRLELKCSLCKVSFFNFRMFPVINPVHSVAAKSDQYIVAGVPIDVKWPNFHGLQKTSTEKKMQIYGILPWITPVNLKKMSLFPDERSTPLIFIF